MGINADENRGPGWYDVAAMYKGVFSRTPVGTVMVVSTSFSVDGRWGMWVGVKNTLTGRIYGACGYGRAYANGAKTMAAACIHALIAAERELEREANPPRTIEQDDIPF